MNSLRNISFLVACQLFVEVVPGFCRSPILSLERMGELGWEEYRAVSNYSQPSHESLDVDCKGSEEHRVRRTSVWIENDYYNVDEEDEPDLGEEQAEIFPSFPVSSFLLGKFAVFSRKEFSIHQATFFGAECGVKNENILDFVENRNYDIGEAAAGA